MNTLVVEVCVEPTAYSVHIGGQLLDSLGSRCRQFSFGKKCALISDGNAGPLYAEPLLSSLREHGFAASYIEIGAGENSKSLARAGEICERLVSEGLDRSSFIVALGGGVIGDLAGFVAAIYHRGIPFVQVPTTLLAQVDSSVGGKTGVNAEGGKNLIGAFHQPRLVLADVTTLRTLPERELNAGFAEIIKHAVIRDRGMFDLLDSPELAPLIARNVEIKAAIVAADERESSGKRALLNFGHTIGHAIENAAGYGRYLHGEAISLGLIAACDLSVLHAGFSTAERDLVVQKLTQFKLPIRLSDEVRTDAVIQALLKDKKFTGGRIQFVLTPRLGEAFVSNAVTLDDIRKAIETLR